MSQYSTVGIDGVGLDVCAQINPEHENNSPIETISILIVKEAV